MSCSYFGPAYMSVFVLQVDLMNSQAQSAVLYADPQYAHIQEQGLLVAGNAAAGVQSAVGTGMSVHFNSHLLNLHVGAQCR